MSALRPIPARSNENFCFHAGDYSFGFNSQEKEKQITSADTHTSAEFWMYDARAGRRWQLDPKPIVFSSSYSVLLNNPIYLNDLKGDTINVYYSFTNNQGKNETKQVFRLDHSTIDGDFTLNEKDVPADFKTIINNSVANLKSPEVLSIEALNTKSDADAIMLSAGGSFGLVGGMGAGIDIIIPKKGDMKDQKLLYFSYQALVTAGGGMSVLMGEVDVRSDLEQTISEKMFMGKSIVYGGGFFGLYQHVESYDENIEDDCAILGLGCPDEDHMTYEADLYGAGGEISLYRGGSYSFYLGAIK
jgi:hypothetical protein